MGATWSVVVILQIIGAQITVAMMQRIERRTAR